MTKEQLEKALDRAKEICMGYDEASRALRADERISRAFGYLERAVEQYVGWAQRHSPKK